MEYKTEFLWEKNARKINEDSIAIQQIMLNNSPFLFAVVCDGIGGLCEGEKASSIAVGRLKQCFENIAYGPPQSMLTIKHRITRELHSIHLALKEYSTEHDTSLGTTVCLTCIYRDKGFILSIGDSRAYQGKGPLKLLTPSHTDSKGRLTRAIGIGTFHNPYYERIKIKKNQLLLLCSDGFYRRNHLYLTHSTSIPPNKDESSIKELLSCMYYHAVNLGESDNCSAIALWK